LGWRGRCPKEVGSVVRSPNKMKTVESQTTQIMLTQPDFNRLEHLVRGWWETDEQTRGLLERLEQELDRARVVASHEIAPDYITLGAEMELVDLETGRRSVYRLGHGPEATRHHQGLSILSPLGIAALGHREGQEFEYEAPGGRQRMRVEKV